MAVALKGVRHGTVAEEDTKNADLSPLSSSVETVLSPLRSLLGQNRSKKFYALSALLILSTRIILKCLFNGMATISFVLFWPLLSNTASTAGFTREVADGIRTWSSSFKASS